MLYTTTIASVLGLASVSSAHMIMNTPVPFGKSTLNNSPLAADGSDFPCKQRTGVYSAEGASNTMAIGSSQPLSFVGSATHGGGSCQISVTYDENPTKSSSFKVIHSIEGGCPIKGVAGNNGDSASAVDPDTYSFTIPSSLPTGTAVLAWTWFNKIGNREMYMNCAPITITGASSKRSEDDLDDLMTRNATQFVERDTAAFDALPDMFVANVGNGCGTVDSADLKFPAPGDSLELDGTATATPVAPTGSCASAVAAASGTAGAAAPAVTSEASAAPVAASSAPTVPGGVFATVASSADVPSAATSVPVAASSVEASPVVASSPATPASAAASSVEASPVVAPSAAASVAASSASPASTGTIGTGSAIVAGTACTTEGMWNCIGGSSFQQCASGTWSVVQQLAAGTSCTSGQTMNIDIVAIVAPKPKRAIRFSAEHVRRHVQHFS
ncbi:hypothetical protein D0Z07_7578 [Hyphodiscus hymeniophilus]|uniref:Lytic polysaccharide monooxygenase n=1 Tax=Hyphodiscus hymeniophilus TaxID=353542 RepID=A0A9P6VEN4_9HELO|nr:hypothetical protein D0Z07_7578 [Hyphodiscus hymeniophilus]